MKKHLLKLLLLCAPALLLVACKGDSLCGDDLPASYHSIDMSDVKIVNSPAMPGEDTIAYNGNIPGKAQFYIGKTFTNLCTEEHMKFEYVVAFKDATPHPIPFKVFGEAYWSAFDDELILYDGIVPENNSAYIGTLEVGLKQAFGDGAGEVDAYVTIEFAAQGSFSADSAYLHQHLSFMELKAIGKYAL